MSMNIYSVGQSEKQGAPPSYAELTAPKHGPMAGYGQTDRIENSELVKGDMKNAQSPIQWMPRPDVKLACPPGLEILAGLSEIQVKQHVERADEFKSWKETSRYRILNSQGQQVFYATEESDECERMWRKGNRSFVMRLTDNTGAEVVRAKRTFKFLKNSCWFAGIKPMAHLVTLETPEGHVVGYVQQRPSACQPRYGVLDADMNEILTVEGPCCCNQPKDAEFTIVTSQDASPAGKISRPWNGKFESCFTHGANFGISLPSTMDVKIKATLIAGCFLIDCMYFEERRHKQCQDKQCEEKFMRWCQKHFPGKCGTTPTSCDQKCKEQ